MSGCGDSQTEIASALQASKPAIFTAPPPPPAQPSHPAPPFPSRVSTYVTPVTLPLDGDLSPPNLGRHQIGILEKLGDGQFGAVHLAELDASSSAIVSNSGGGGGGLRKCVFLRLVRMSDDSSVSDWIRDVSRLSVLRDPSIAKVVAMATDLSSGTDDVTMGFMTEYLEGGPLPVYLRQYRLGAADNFDPGVKTIRYCRYTVYTLYSPI